MTKEDCCSSLSQRGFPNLPLQVVSSSTQPITACLATPTSWSMRWDMSWDSTMYSKESVKENPVMIPVERQCHPWRQETCVLTPLLHPKASCVGTQSQLTTPVASPTSQGLHSETIWATQVSPQPQCFCFLLRPLKCLWELLGST